MSFCERCGSRRKIIHRLLSVYQLFQFLLNATGRLDVGASISSPLSFFPLKRSLILSCVQVRSLKSSTRTTFLIFLTDCFGAVGGSCDGSVSSNDFFLWAVRNLDYPSLIEQTSPCQRQPAMTSDWNKTCKDSPLAPFRQPLLPTWRFLLEDAAFSPFIAFFCVGTFFGVVERPHCVSASCRLKKEGREAWGWDIVEMQEVPIQQKTIWPFMYGPQWGSYLRHWAFCATSLSFSVWLAFCLWLRCRLCLSLYCSCHGGTTPVSGQTACTHSTIIYIQPIQIQKLQVNGRSQHDTKTTRVVTWRSAGSSQVFFHTFFSIKSALPF